MTHDVFISYAMEDSLVADAVCKALEEGGVQCWYAPRDVPYAVDYEEAIVDAISQSKLMLLILSAHANNSAHVKREVQNACREEPQIPVLPFQIADVPLSKSFRYYIGSVQWLIASTPPLEAHLQKLVNYVQGHLPRPEQDGDSGTQGGQPVQAEVIEKDEEEALRLAEEAERRKVEEEERLAAEAEAQRKAEEERQRIEAEEKRRTEEEAAQRRAAEEEAARHAAEERRREEEERERREAEEAARRQAEEERVRAEAEARKQAEQEEAERLRVEAEQAAERLRLEEEKQARAEEEQRKQEAAGATRRAEEERQQREEEERRQREAAESKQQREEAARQKKERQAEERRASEARFRELNLAARQKPLDKSSMEVTAEDVSTPTYKNRRVMLLAAASLIVLVVAAGIIWLTRRHGNPNQATTQLAPDKSGHRPGEIVRNRIGMEFVYVPAGSFMMGSNDLFTDETPVHEVTLQEGFYMGKYEVTQEQWQSMIGVMGDPSGLRGNPSGFRGDKLPVETVSWNDAQDFIRKLNEMNDGYTYRLPTEAEWEYACRAGTTGILAGDLDAMAWYDKNSGSTTHPVGSKQPNSLGLYDMYGNVAEFCQDWWGLDYGEARADGMASENVSIRTSKIIRGGSWRDSDWGTNSAYRTLFKLDWRANHVGLRIVAVARS